MMDEARRHPDIFTDEEAAAYLHLDGPQSLEIIRRNYGLSGYRPAGKGYLYWREDLDNAALAMFGRRPAIRERQVLKLAGRFGS